MKTVYVIGAGASAEVGMPTGNELKKEISSLLKVREDNPLFVPYIKDELIDYTIKKISQNGKRTKSNSEEYYNAARLISENVVESISIDHYINAHKEDKRIETIAKIAIVKILLEKEKNSDLYRKYFLNSGDLINKWYTTFFNLLTEFKQKDNVQDRLQKITLIIFNYDRCVEYYLLNRFNSHFNIDMYEAAKLLKCIKIIHPYGCIGELPINVVDSGDNNVGFGNKIDVDRLLNLKNNIKTFTEETNPSSEIMFQVRDSLVESKRIVFLGFAYNSMNMEILSLNHSNVRTNLPKILGTTHGEPSSGTQDIINDIAKAFKITTKTPELYKLDNLKCHEFFEENKRALRFN